MPAWLAAVIAAIWEVIKPLLTPAAAAVVGAELQKGQDAYEALDHIQKGDKAAAATRGWSRADRMRFLEQRGRVRDLS